MKKTAVISYLALPKIPIGLHQIGNVDIFTRDYASIRDSDSPDALTKKICLLKELHKDVMEHIDEYSTIYIHVGRFPDMDLYKDDWPIFMMLGEYKKNSKVTIVGCTCSLGWKRLLADSSGGAITWEIVPCDPEEQLLAIIKRENNLVCV